MQAKFNPLSPFVNLTKRQPSNFTAAKDTNPHTTGLNRI
ncbi:hypothetical protein CAMRE0001_1111 [Campylobacter rectus RM3267]|uniref:Uncharacterized protein n=1 Tax=Campylobacter rectus RM3267 TaxID=553218 RepID=B9D5K0_CAMRE|nr:hypothetical protein CAMRE0001_1111 [Campylobacter rectus RM3267]